MQEKISNGLRGAGSHKGQVATEFLLYTGLFIFILLAAFISITFIQNAEIPSRQSGVVKEGGAAFASAVNLAVRGGQGFEYSYTFPRTILGRDYDVVFDTRGHRIQITWHNGNKKESEPTYFYPIADYPYTFAGCLSRPDSVNRLISNDITCKNTLKFRNNDGRLTITQER